MALSITLTALTGGASVTLTRGVAQSSDFGKDLRNTISGETIDGSFIGSSNGPKIVRGVLNVEFISKAERDDLISFLVDSIQFIKPFNITIYPGADIGAGDGNTLTVNWTGDKTTRGYIVANGRGLKFNVSIPYLSTSLVGTGGGVAVAD